MSELVFNRVIMERSNQVLSLLGVISLALNVLFLFVLIHIDAKPPVIVYAQDGQLEVIRSRNLSVDETFLKDFTKMIAGQYLSFSGNSLPKQIEEIKPYLAPKPLNAILDSFKSNQNIIEKDNISQQFVVNAITITKKTNPFWLEVQGARNIYAAGNEKTVPMTYVFEIKKIKPTDNNPYGFLLTDVIEKEKLIKKGQDI